jgi:predicted nucleic acid-binding protein
MTTYFLDSSAISKGYVVEIGSAWIMALIAPAAGHVIVISSLALVEVSSVLARKQRLAQISAADAAQNRADFVLDVREQFLAVPLDEPVLQRASDLVGKYPLRSLDALQLACAIEATTVLSGPHIFVCADTNLLKAAAVEGFATDNPLLHP